MQVASRRACVLSVIAWVVWSFARPAVAQAASSHCLSYEPSVVKLTGTLVRKTFPGPPNYEDISRGDRPETYWLLVLSRPACVDADKAQPDLNPAHDDIRT